MPAKTNRPPRDAVRHPVFARCYARMSVISDQRAGTAAHRAELLAGLSGRVAEIGAGNGRNFAHYPDTVTEVVAVEPERTMRQLAAEEALGVKANIDVLPGTAEELPLADSSCDAAVTSLVLCSLPDVKRALREIARVLRPGGELRFYEHGVAEGRPGLAAVQRAVDATVWPRLFGGCHTSREPLADIEGAGFTELEFRRVRVPEGGPALPHAFHVLGRARRP
ncbi:class I SAM-dependent methyltransferase [Streptomyces iconiensis]|uniref:Class I SAM-dependent methyltransferase n=1 Tax=Streptomyces iconiensis TaxID=1384038 RepID=A0ABT7A8N5_9ACTN|nr:class I SAM-dependent methyltransferase [Streptomyces iconiensis]MDJ1137676.1 class I SAM-dependent methyltransferase [Streptomyces iconiensis]